MNQLVGTDPSNPIQQIWVWAPSGFGDAGDISVYAIPEPAVTAFVLGIWCLACSPAFGGRGIRFIIRR